MRTHAATPSPRRARASSPREMWRVYRTLVGRVLVRTARAVVVIGGRRPEVYVETPMYGASKSCLTVSC